MEIPGRILAIDPGTRRIGYALSDDLRFTVRPLEVWVRRGLEADLEHLAELVKAHEVTEILLGVPYRLDGSESGSTARALEFGASIRAALPHLPVKEQDEALTSWQAERRLAAEGVPPRARKARVDAYAAAAMLEEALGLAGSFEP